MIKFFRKIRQNLLMENKTGKYLKYAIGEIALVVIGILIALSINNWNEERKSSKLEIKILKELNNDLKTNFAEVDETFNTTNNRQVSTVLIFDYFKNKYPVDDSLKQAFEIINMDGLFNVANTAYKFIENQGVNTLSNDSIRIRITEMYERLLKNIQTREANNWEIVNKELLPLMNQHFVSSPTIDSTISFSVEAINMPKDIESLREDAEFRNVLLRLQNWLILRLKWQKETLATLEQLIMDVQIEIDKLSN